MSKKQPLQPQNEPFIPETIYVCTVSDESTGQHMQHGIDMEIAWDDPAATKLKDAFESAKPVTMSGVRFTVRRYAAMGDRYRRMEVSLTTAGEYAPETWTELVQELERRAQCIAFREGDYA